jgi:glycosyltransferase involved in cell wall biosynthesis
MNAKAEVQSRNFHPLASEARPVRLLTVLEANSVTGPARAFIEFCRAAPALSAAVVVFRRPGDAVRREEHAALERALAEAGIQWRIIPERFRFDARVVSLVEKTAQSIEPDIIETHSVKSHAVIWASGMWRRIPWLAYHHGYTNTDVKVRAYNLADHLTLRAADRVITVANAFVPMLTRRGVLPDRLHVVHNALTTSARHSATDRQSARRAVGLPDSIPVVLSLGRLSREKGTEDLLRAFAVLLARRNRDGMLVIGGDGPERPRLERIARELGVARRTSFVGYLLDPAPFLAAADVFAMPSLSEGSPYALLEALAAGLPIVATQAGGIPEMVSHETTALLTAPGDYPALADSIDRLLIDHALAQRIAANGRRHFLETFNAKTRADRLLHVYDKVFNDRRARRWSRR